MEARGAPAEDDLLQSPWCPVNISGCQLLTKSRFGGTSYRLLLTDMLCVWEERMDEAAIQTRAQELNKRLRASVGSFFSHLCSVVRPHLSREDGSPDGGAQISMSRQEDGSVSLRLKSEFLGMPFKWEFHCTPAPVTLVCAQLVRPLLAMSRLLQMQVEQLGGLLVRKDAEIQDYRENGATLSRERLQTEAFEEQTYREDFVTKTLPQLCSDVQSFNADLQQLYAAVVVPHRNTRKRKLSEERPFEKEKEKEKEEEEEDQLTSREPALTLSPGDGSDSSEPDRNQSHNGRAEESGSKMADRGAGQQSVTAASDPPAAKQPSSKPKKKKVGLFR